MVGGGSVSGVGARSCPASANSSISTIQFVSHEVQNKFDWKLHIYKEVRCVLCIPGLFEFAAVVKYVCLFYLDKNERILKQTSWIHDH